MEIDANFVRARFAAMTHEELLEEVALRADEYQPLARGILEGEALARGIDRARVEARRAAAAEGAPEPAIDLPALLVSADDKAEVTALAAILRERGLPALVRDLDPQSFHCSGHRVGRWGLMVPGLRAGEAARILESVVPPAPPEQAPGCAGSCPSCADEGESDGDPWPEDGDWWRTQPGEEDAGESLPPKGPRQTSSRR